MGVMDKIRRLLGMVEGREEQVAEQISKRTSVSKQQAEEGISTVQRVVGEESTRSADDEGRT